MRHLKLSKQLLSSCVSVLLNALCKFVDRHMISCRLRSIEVVRVSEVGAVLEVWQVALVLEV